MDLKKESARFAFSMIKNDSHVGLGDGTSIRWLVDFIKEGIQNGLHIRLSTSSVQTEKYLEEKGLSVTDYSALNQLDQYFDGCDEVDYELNAFKSGAGIHTTEKLLASMAGQFILLADSSKYVPRLRNTYPLVLEILPLAIPYVIKKMEVSFPGVSLSIRIHGTEGPVKTRYGNYLVDCRFIQLPDLEFLQNLCKNVVGVVEISLFYQIAHQAIIADEKGMRRYQKVNKRVQLAEQIDFKNK